MSVLFEEINISSELIELTVMAEYHNHFEQLRGDCVQFYYEKYIHFTNKANSKQ